VQASAPPEAVIVAKAAMITAYESRFRGITYSKCDVAASGGSTEGFPREQGIHANAAQSFDIDEFEEVAPDENNDDVD
jgi:hypothetical protein